MNTETKKLRRKVAREQVDGLVEQIFGGEVHAQRVASMSNGVDGVLQAAALGIRAIGHGLAAANGLAPRHAIKQVDRLLSNPKMSRDEMLRCWVQFVVGERKAPYVNFAWTEFEESDQSTIVLGTQTEHGRSTPLLWKTVTRSQLKAPRNAHEDERLCKRAELRPEGVRITVVADRGFSDTKLYRFLTEALGFHSIIRFRGVVQVESAKGERRKAKEGLGVGGRMRVLRNARVTALSEPVPVVVCVQDKAMKEPWLLVSSRSDLIGSEIKRAYGKRFTVEETFRDVKNPRLGLGLKQTVIERNDRRDVLFLLAVLAHTLLRLLGKAGQALGMERWLGGTRPGQYSLFRQGQMLFDLIPNIDKGRLRKLLTRFGQLLREHALLSQVLGYL
jgi:hypothetical protein